VTYFPRIRPVLRLSQWCAFVLAAFLAAVVGMMAGTLAAAAVWT
jgi:hypothetical protein